MSTANKNLIIPTRKAQLESVALFISDLHLQETLPRTTQAFFNFLRQHAMHTRQLYLLGDLFEYWAGDDDIDTPYYRQITSAIRQVADTGVAIFWMAGNRDFLTGRNFCKAIGATQLPDPFVTTIIGQRVALTHGDAQCTDDQAYMAFRAQVRTSKWQKDFLALPLTRRKTIIEGLRKDSREAQRTKPDNIMDVNTASINTLFEVTSTSVMIHGHTHRPDCHTDHANNNRVRYVLPDWNYDTPPNRGGWISINVEGTITRFDKDGAILS